MLLVARRRIARRAHISDLHRDEHRCSAGLEFLLPTEQHTRGYPIATRHPCNARERALRPPSVPPHIAKRPVRTDRVRQAQNKRARNGRFTRSALIPCSRKFPVPLSKTPCSVA